MEIKMDFNDLEININGLTVRKVTDKYIRENFDLKYLAEKNSKTFEEVSHIPIEKLFYAKEFTVNVYLSIMQSLFGDYDSIKTIRTSRGMFFEVKREVKKEISEKEVSDLLKDFIKTKIKESK